MKNFFLSFFLVTSVCAAPIKLQQIVTGLLDPTLAVTAPGNPNRIYILEQKGRIVTVENGRLQEQPFLDIRTKVTNGPELGLLGLAFHPDFATNGRYFINYNIDKNGLFTIVAELNSKNDVEKEILRFSQPYSNHNGGGMEFGPDGFLYITTGDGGSAGDPQGNGQKLTTLLGKILRIDVNKGSPYSIPTDNPFQKGNQRKEIYAYGMRNAWRFSFDKLTGVLFAADVGQDKWEEIHTIEKGKNYGWNIMEGKHCFRPATSCDQTGLDLPIWEYPHSQGTSITGGYVYRGKKIPALDGVYVYGDWGSGKVWGLTYNQTTKTVVKNELLLSSNRAITSFGQEPDGELLMMTSQGALYRLVPGPVNSMQEVKASVLPPRQ